MWPEAEADDRAIRYLLGELSPEERDQFEDRYFADAALHEQLQAIEEELIDSYVRGELSSEQRTHFEQRFLQSPERRERCDFAKALAKLQAATSVSAHESIAGVPRTPQLCAPEAPPRYANLAEPARRDFRFLPQPSLFRRLSFAAAAGVALFLSLVWTISWAGNRNLIATVRNRVRDAQRGSDDLSLANLQALDRLREQLVQLDESHPLLHWGLYQGKVLRDQARNAYFERLRSLSLGRLNQTLTVDLMQAGAPGNSTTESAIYEALKTHRTITALACRPVDPAYISRGLKDAAAEAHPGLNSEQQALLFKQLEFYAADLAKTGLPVSLNENSTAEKTAEAYLRQTRGPEQQLRRLLEQVDQQAPRLIAAKSVPGLERVLKGQEEVRGAFTSQGRQNFEELLAQNKLPPEEACVMGTTTLRGSHLTSQVSQLMDTGMKEQLQSLYYKQYISTWHDFLASYHVLGYPNGYIDANDEVRKLDILAAPKSPLLGLVKLVAANTNFPAESVAKSAEDPGVFGKAEDALKGAVQGKAKAKGVDKLLGTKSVSTTAADVAKVFQSASFTTPADSDSLVSDHNQAYIGGLRMLQEKMDTLAQASSAAEKTAAMADARTAQGKARNLLKQIADNFHDFRNEGMDTVVSSLLEEPIDLAGGLLTTTTTSPVSQNDQEFISQVCSPMRQILTKYPFNRSAKDADVSLGELETWFAPNTGKIWKYASGSGAELVVLKEDRWEPNPMLQDMKVSPELLTFLNGAQMVTKAFFADGRTKPRFTYKLRPAAGQAITIQLKLDGVEMGKTFQTDFSWPPASGSSVAEGTAIRPDGSSQPFGRYTDLWAVFRLFDAAAPREPNAKDVQWDKVRGDGGQLQPFSPPVKVEILSFPGGVDVFQPAFFESLRQCPKKAVEELKQ